MFNHVLVTGSNSFVGKYLVSQLENTNEIQFIYCGQRTVNQASNAKVVNVEIDLTTPINVQCQVDVIFHIAAEKNNEEKMIDVNENGTRRLVEWAASHGVKKIVLLSSVGVYGAGKRNGTINEDSRRTPQNLYEKTKNSAESIVKRLCSERSIDYVIFQPTNILGISHRGTHPLLSLIRSIKNDRFVYFGDGSAWFNYIAVQDVSAALMAGLDDRAANDTFILNTPLRLKTAVDIIADSLSVHRIDRRIPRIAGFCAAEVATFLTKAFSVSIPFDKSRYQELTNTTYYDGNRIQDKLEFIYPKGLDAVLKDLVESYSKEGLLQ